LIPDSERFLRLALEMPSWSCLTWAHTESSRRSTSVAVLMRWRSAGLFTESTLLEKPAN